MRGAETFTEGLFTLKKLDDFVPSNYPLRIIRTMVNKALAEMGELFAQKYADEIKGGHAHAHLGTNPSGGGVMRGRRLEMVPNPAETGLEWGDLALRSACITVKRTLMSAAKLRALGISAAC